MFKPVYTPGGKGVVEVMMVSQSVSSPKRLDKGVIKKHGERPQSRGSKGIRGNDLIGG